MKDPTLVVMAAGIGSRFGGLKQMAPVGKSGEPIIEFSLYDAISAGFRKVVFIIKPELEEDFRRLIGGKVKDKIQVEYAFQGIDKLPPGFMAPDGRTKPWGTGHAALCSKDFVNGPFAVINADDFYGREGFQVLADFLKEQKDDHLHRFCMVGFRIENTLTENGHVARGVCQMDGKFLKQVVERVHIEHRAEGIQYTEDNGDTWSTIPEGTLVSMNLWGFSPAFLDALEAYFPARLEEILRDNPLKGEYFLPLVVNNLLEEGKATVEVLQSPAKWYGITYREDMETVTSAIRAMQDQGIYPERLFL